MPPTSCQFVSVCFSKHLTQSVRAKQHNPLTVMSRCESNSNIWERHCWSHFQPGINLINFLMASHLHPTGHLVGWGATQNAGGLWAMPVVFGVSAEVFWWPDLKITSRTFATAGLNMHDWENHSDLLVLTGAGFPFTHFHCKLCQKKQSTL